MVFYGSGNVLGDIPAVADIKSDFCLIEPKNLIFSIYKGFPASWIRPAEKALSSKSGFFRVARILDPLPAEVQYALTPFG